MAALRVRAVRLGWVIPRPGDLQRMDDAAVCELLSTRGGNRRRTVEAVCADLGRRARDERRARAKAARLAKARAARVIERLDYDNWVHGQYIAASHACRGVLVNKAGRNRIDRFGQPAAIEPLSLFSGQASRAAKWASEELREWWDQPGNGRMTFAEWKAGEREPAPDLSDPRQALVEVA
jgi:sirohydrochlorin ferrochelatase